MDRFGRANYRGAGPMKPFGAHSAPNTRSGLLGAGPSYQSSNQYSSSGQHGNPSQEWSVPRSNATGSILGQPPKRAAQYGNNSYDSDRSNQGWRQQTEDNSPAVPAEVKQLMQSLGLSQSDMEKLSQLPEKDLSSVNNLARAIGDLRQGKQLGSRPRSEQYDPSDPTPAGDRSGSYGRGSRGPYHERDGRPYNRGENGLLGNVPSSQQNPYPAASTQKGYGSDMTDSNQKYHIPTANRHKPTGIKVTVKPSQRSGPLADDSRYYDSKSSAGYSQRDDRGYNDHYDEKPFYGRDESADRYDQQRNDSFSDNRRLSNKNVSQREAKPQGFGNERRVASRDRPSNTTPSDQRTLPRPVGTRNIPKPSSGAGLLHNPGGLLGNPLQPNAQGLENLAAAAVGRSPTSGSLPPHRSSMLNPLVLASQADPTMLEAQIQAMKALQAEAIKMQDKSSNYETRSSRDSVRLRRRTPPSRGSGIDRRLEEEARKEAQEMRAMRGRVLYIRFKSARVDEADLKQLAIAFGRVTNVVMIQQIKVKNGHYQALMEMEQWDCAAAMLEHYMVRPPSIRGCLIEVQRSNYRDLQVRSDQVQKERKRTWSRSISPVRKGTTQLPHKRERRKLPQRKTDESSNTQGRKSAEKLNVSITTTSKSDRRVVTRSSEESSGNKDSKSDSKKAESIKLDDKKVDAREILNRTRTKEGRRESDRTSTRSRRSDLHKRSPPGSRLRKRSPDNRRSSRRSIEEPKEKVRRLNSEKDNNKDDSTDKKAIVTKTADDSDKKNDASNEEKTSESEKTKEDRDPLDVIADELALHDEFVLMDEVGYEGEQKKSEDDSSKKEEGKDQNSGKHDLGMDLERPDLDLEDVNVDMSQDEVGTIEMGNDEEMDIGEETAGDSTDKKDETIDTEKETELEKTDVDVAENDLNNETTQVAEERPAEEDAENTGMAKDSILTSDILEEIDVKKEATAVEKDEGVTLTPEVKVENEPLESEDPSTEVKTTSSDDTEIKDTTVEDSYIELEDSILEGSQNESQITEYDSEVSGDESKIIQDGSKMAEDESTNIFELFDDIATPKQVQEKILEGSQEQFDAGSSRPESEEEFGNVEESKVGELQSVVKDTLKEVVTAKEHLLAFTKATKNRAALAIAKKLKVCLEVAITRLESADSI